MSLVNYGMGRRRRVGRPRRRHGAGFFSSLGNALSKAHDFVKSNHLVSTIGNALGSVGVPYASQVGSLAGKLGYGLRRRRVVRRRPLVRRRLVARPLVRRRRVIHRRHAGGSLRSILTAAHGIVKKHQLASKLLTHLGHPKAASVASSLGYGRRRRVHRRVVRHRGGAIFGTEQIARPIF